MSRRSAALALVVVAGGAVALAGLAGCNGTSSTGKIGLTPSVSALSPATASFSGSVPSGLATLASSAAASVSSASASMSSAAASFEASVSAQTAQQKAAAEAALASVTGSGNALADVTLTGVPRSTTGGMNAALVTIVNSSGARASYAVRVGFVDSSGAVLDSTVVGAENLDPGQTASPVAFSSLASDLVLLPKVLQAQRY